MPLVFEVQNFDRAFYAWNHDLNYLSMKQSVFETILPIHVMFAVRFDLHALATILQSIPFVIRITIVKKKKFLKRKTKTQRVLQIEMHYTRNGNLHTILLGHIVREEIKNSLKNETNRLKRLNLLHGHTWLLQRWQLSTWNSNLFWKNMDKIHFFSRKLISLMHLSLSKFKSRFDLFLSFFIS